MTDVPGPPPSRLRDAGEVACPPRRRGRGALFAALACAHCSLTAVFAVLSLGFGFLPTVFGFPTELAMPPLVIGGLLALWFWTGRGRRARA